MTIGYEQTYQLRTDDFDRYSRLQPASVLDVFQDVAGVSAELTPGMTWREITDAGLVWVVTRIKYEVLDTPKLHEQVIARTWPLAPNRLGFQRDYTIKSLDGRLLVRGSSDWVMMDINTRSFASSLDFYKGPYDFSTETAFDTKLRRIRPFKPTDEGRIITPEFTDIDINGHVNNTRYASYVMNTWVPNEDEAIKTFQIDYRHEIRPGTSIRVHMQHKDGEVNFMGMSADDEHMFAAKLELA